MYNEINQYNSPNYTPKSKSRAVFGLDRTIDGIVVHWWGDPAQGPTLMGVVNWLCNTRSQSSAHAICSGTNRQVAWIVNACDVAWHAGNARGNATTIGIESDPRCRAEDYDVLAELIADIWIAYGRKLPLYPHRYWANTACPGNYDMNRIQAEANAWYARKTAPAPTPPVTKPVPNAVKLSQPVKFKATTNPTQVWDLTTNPNYKSVKTLKVGDEFIAYAYIDFNNSKYYLTEYSYNKGLKNGVNTVDLMKQVTVPPAPETPPVQVTPEPVPEPVPETPVEVPPIDEPDSVVPEPPVIAEKTLWDLIVELFNKLVDFLKSYKKK